MHVNELEAAIDHARDFNRSGNLDPYSEDTFEGLASKFAELAVQLADRCVVGLPCERHSGAVHGREAEELRKGIEQTLHNTADVESDEASFVLEGLRKSLYFLLDRIDARDSLAFLERSSPSVPSATVPGGS
jgi:hypothetical protein